MPLGDMIQKATRTGHDDIGAAFEGFDLGVHVHAAEDDRAAHAGITAEGADGIVRLGRQFAGGRQDQCPHAPARFLHQVLQQRQNKGRCLAGPGLGEAHDVPPVQDVGNGLMLDRRGAGIGLLMDRGGDVRMKIELLKCHTAPLYRHGV